MSYFSDPPYYISAYALAKKRGFAGSLDDWLNSLVGPKGPPGKTAYEYALAGGFVGSEEEFARKMAAEVSVIANAENMNRHMLSIQNPHGVTAEQVGALPLGGGAMIGPIIMGSHKVTGLGDPTADGDAVNLSTLNAAVRVSAPVNLLDNSDFRNPVNQRGGDLYSGAAQYTIDRWRIPSGLDLVVEDGYIELLCTSETTANGMSQSLPESKIPAVGEKVTLACKTHDGTIHVGSVTMPESGYATAFTINGNVYCRIYGGSEGECRFVLMVAAGARVIVEWVALYMGEYTADTLPDFRLKDRAPELLECQRQYLRYADSAFSGFGYVYSAVTAYVIITIPIKMRITPTVTGDALFTVRTYGETATDCPLGSAVYMSGNQIRFSVDITGKGLTPGSALTAVRSSGTLEFSAEL